MAFDSGRGSFKPFNLQYASFPIQSCSDIFAHQTPHLMIVSSYDSCEFLRIGLPVKDDNWDAFIINLIDNG